MKTADKNETLLELAKSRRDDEMADATDFITFLKKNENETIEVLSLTNRKDTYKRQNLS